MDFRSHKMAKGGLACVNTFRKANSVNAIKSKYTSVVRTAEQIADEEAQAALDKDDYMESEEEEQEVKSITKKKAYTINDIMEIDTKLSLKKKTQI